MREKGTYVILRALHKHERDPGVAAACEKLIQVRASRSSPGSPAWAESYRGVWCGKGGATWAFGPVVEGRFSQTISRPSERVAVSALSISGPEGKVRAAGSLGPGERREEADLGINMKEGLTGTP